MSGICVTHLTQLLGARLINFLVLISADLVIVDVGEWKRSQL
ncbi:MAG: hypothetical protein AB3A66_01720 [Nodularia sp. CChRGM 3473]